LLGSSQTTSLQSAQPVDGAGLTGDPAQLKDGQSFMFLYFFFFFFLKKKSKLRIGKCIYVENKFNKKKVKREIKLYLKSPFQVMFIIRSIIIKKRLKI